MPDQAEKLESLVPHSDAVPARCAHYGQGCGGCAMQDLAYPAQLRAKRRQVRAHAPVLLFPWHATCRRHDGAGSVMLSGCLLGWATYDSNGLKYRRLRAMQRMMCSLQIAGASGHMTYEHLVELWSNVSRAGRWWT